MPTQTPAPMFQQDAQDLPLFSGTPARGKYEIFTPKPPAPRQESFYPVRPEPADTYKPAPNTPRPPKTAVKKQVTLVHTFDGEAVYIATDQIMDPPEVLQTYDRAGYPLQYKDGRPVTVESRDVTEDIFITVCPVWKRRR